MGLTFLERSFLIKFLVFFYYLFIHSGALFFFELMLVMYIFVESSISLRFSKNFNIEPHIRFFYLKNPISVFIAPFPVSGFGKLQLFFCLCFLNELAREVAIHSQIPFFIVVFLRVLIDEDLLCHSLWISSSALFVSLWLHELSASAILLFSQ